MDIFTNKKIVQKIVIILCTSIILTFSIVPSVHAQDDWGFGGDILEQLIKLFDSVGDIVMGLLNKSFLGTEKILDSVMLYKDDINATSTDDIDGDGREGGIWYYNENAEIKKEVYDLDGFIWGDFKIPNMLYCPENIFSNNIASLDINFLSPNDYVAVEKDGEGTVSDSAEKAAQSSAGKLQKIISSWYNTFKNIAIVALLSVLVYIGIRIVLSSTSPEKAKYKERLMDWLVALCLVFFIHFIMSGIIMLTNLVTDIFAESVNEGIAVIVKDREGEGGTELIRFNTNYMGYIRLLAQSNDVGVCTAYSIMYLALVIFTVMFTITYLKRFLYMAFFTMIAPLVAITYPLDKLGDSKAQAFTMWLREYAMNAIIQPVHLILYTVFVVSAMELATENPIYACVALGFLLPAETFIKKMFGFDKASSTGTLGAIAGGAIAMKGVNTLAKTLSGGSSKSKGNGSNSDGNGQDKIRLSRGKNDDYDSDPLNVIAGGNSDSGSGSGSGGGLGSGSGSGGGLGSGSGLGGGLGSGSGSGGGSGSGSGSGGGLSSGSGSSPSRFTRFKNSKPIRGITAIANQKRDAIAGKFTKENAKKVIKGVAKTGVKLAGAGIGAAALGALGAAAAITTGDLEKGAGFIAGGLTLGGAAGANAGGRIVDAADNTISSAIDEYKNATTDPAEAKRARQAKFDKEWKNRKENYEYLMNQGMTRAQAEKMLNNKDTQKFLNAGITDINKIYNAQQLRGYSNEKAVALAEMAKKVGGDFETNHQEQAALKKNLIEQGIAPDVATQTIKDIIKVNKT